MKILITGGGGFLGLHLARFLSKKGFDLILLDLNELPPNEYPKGVEFVKGDIRNKPLMDKLTRNVDVIIHAAAALPLWPKEDIFSVNVRGTKNLLQSSLKNKVKHFVYISSTAVYGVPKKHPVYENDPKVGVGPYGESKILAEQAADEYRQKGLLVTTLRPKTFVGTHRLGVFEILFDWIKDGKKIPVVGSGRNRYQLLDVDDLVEVIYKSIIINDKRKVNDNFNVGAAEFKTVEKDLGDLFKVAKSGSRILKTPAWPIKKTLFILEKLNLSPLYQWVYETADKDSFVSIKKIQKALNWKPKYSNARALIKAYKWYESHYKEIKKGTPGVTHTVGWKQGILGLFKRFL